MKTSVIIKEARQELLDMENRLTKQLAEQSHDTITLDLVRVCSRVSCAIANRDEKGITQIKWRQHNRELKQALKEQDALVIAILRDKRS